jgi:protein involved in polysaccharide export with SLBB domain
MYRRQTFRQHLWSEADLMGTFQAQQRPRLVRGRDLFPQRFENATNLGYLLGIAPRQLPAANEKTVLEPDSHIAAQ